MFTVRDLAWKEFRRTGNIDIGPSFSSLTILGSKPADYAKADCGGYPPVPPADCAKASPLLYSLAGFQFDKIQDPNLWNCSGTGCFEVYWGMDRFLLSPGNFQVGSKTTAAMQWSQQPTPEYTYAYKSLRFVWHATDDDAYEWDLSIPQETKTSVTASAILNVGDSTQITFSGVELSGTPTLLTFDNVPLTAGTFTYAIDKKTLTVLITTSMTAKPGHKEFTVTDPQPVIAPAKPKVTQLPFDVTRR